MPNNDTKKRQLTARYDDDLARIREAERKYEARRKYLLGNLVMVLRDRNPEPAQQIIMDAAKLASRDYDRAELAHLAHGSTSRSRLILLGALLLSYAARVPSDRRMFDLLRPLARSADRDLLADIFEHRERHIPGRTSFDTSKEAAARAEQAERRRDAVHVAAMRKAVRDGLPLPEDDDDGDPGAERVPGTPRGSHERER